MFLPSCSSCLQTITYMHIIKIYCSLKLQERRMEKAQAGSEKSLFFLFLGARKTDTTGGIIIKMHAGHAQHAKLQFIHVHTVYVKQN